MKSWWNCRYYRDHAFTELHISTKRMVCAWSRCTFTYTRMKTVKEITRRCCSLRGSRITYTCIHIYAKWTRSVTRGMLLLSYYRQGRRLYVDVQRTWTHRDVTYPYTYSLPFAIMLFAYTIYRNLISDLKSRALTKRPRMVMLFYKTRWSWMILKSEGSFSPMI